MNTDKSREIRKYLYALLVAIGPLLSFYGVATSDEITLWLGVGGTLLGVPAGTTALANLNPKAGVTVPPEGEQNTVIWEGDPLELEGQVSELDDPGGDDPEVEDPFAGDQAKHAAEV